MTQVDIEDEELLGEADDEEENEEIERYANNLSPDPQKSQAAQVQVKSHNLFQDSSMPGVSEGSPIPSTSGAARECEASNSNDLDNPHPKRGKRAPGGRPLRDLCSGDLGGEALGKAPTGPSNPK